MIYSIVGSNAHIRGKANKELSTLGEVTHRIYKENVETLRGLVDASSLFGDVIVVSCIQLFDDEVGKKTLVSLLETMSASPNIFIIDEPFANVHTINKLAKVSKKVFDAKEGKEKDVGVFTLCNLFAKRDKKGVWIEWMSVRNFDSPEAIAGALWWKFCLLWGDVLLGKNKTFTQAECEMIGGKLLRASILAHRGQADLKGEIEKVLLSI